MESTICTKSDQTHFGETIFQLTSGSTNLELIENLCWARKSRTLISVQQDRGETIFPLTSCFAKNCLKHFGGLSGKSHILTSVENEPGGNHGSRNILYRLELFENLHRERCGKRHLLNPVKEDCGETILQLAFCFTNGELSAKNNAGPRR